MVTYMATVYFYLPTSHFHAIMKLRTNGALIATETIQRALLSSLFGCLKIIGNNCSPNTDLYDTTNRRLISFSTCLHQLSRRRGRFTSVL